MPSNKPAFYRLRLFWRDMPLARKGIVIVVMPLMLLLGSLSLLYAKESQLSQLESQLRTALQNQRDIQAVHTQLLEASNGVRDFLLTDDKHFLNIFYEAQHQIPAIMTSLATQLETHAQTERLNAIQPLVDQNLQNLQFLALSEPDSDSNTLIDQFKLQVSSLDQLRRAIDELNKQEAYLVEQDQTNLALQRERNFKVTLLAAIIGLIGSVMTLWVFLDTIVNRVKALRDSARHLAKAEPLDLPFSSLDELGQLSDELDQASQLLANKVEETNQAKFEAEEANRAKTLFLSRTSHELRTPLNAILGFAQLLESELTHEHQQNKAGMIRRAGDHLLKLINDVLDIASIESGEHQLNIEPININQLIDEAVNYIASLGRIRDMEIVQHIPSDLMAKADYQKAFQVLLNLLSNALKYGPVSSTVLVKAYETPHHIHIEVLDEGTGIPEDLRKRLFTPFDRLGAEQSNIEGSGLGLALSKQIMTALNGDLEVSQHRSLFTMTLPNHHQSHSALKTDQSAITARHTMLDLPNQITQHNNVLLVEDNDSNKTLIEAILNRESHLHLLHSKTLKSAKVMLSHDAISLVILDLHLPDGSGETLIDYIQSHQEYAHIPIVILSADATPETIHRVKQRGVIDYLTKPLNVAEFSRTIKSIFLN